MSLKHAAHHLASKGRGPDTTLVHMSKDEVKSLQQLAMAHGGSLTINPQTGLPEAGFLSAVLPMAAGAALMYAVPGMDPVTAGMIVGGGTGVATGSVNKGLSAGLGAYGGAGLGAGFGASAVPAGTVPAAGAGTAGAAGTAGTAGTTGLNTTTVPGFETANLTANSIPSTANLTAGGLEPLSGTGSALQTGLTPPPVAPPPVNGVSPAGLYGTPAGPATSIAPPASGVSPATLSGAPSTTPPPPVEKGIGTQVLENVKANPRYGMAALGSLAADMMNQPRKTGQTPKADEKTMQYGYRSGYDNKLKQQTGPQEYYEKGYAANGGLMSSYADGGDVQYPYSEPVVRMNNGGQSDSELNPQLASMVPENMRPYLLKQRTAGEQQNYANGGISSALGGYSDGGRLLRGPGDGVSDSIPAVIGNKQPARLADGEFVVPARIVSEIGNGSTEAGARKLYAMMDRVQKARGKTVGKGKVAKNTRADKYLPA